MTISTMAALRGLKGCPSARSEPWRRHPGSRLPAGWARGRGLRPLSRRRSAFPSHPVEGRAGTSARRGWETEIQPSMTIQGGFLIIDRLVLARLGDETKPDRFQVAFLEIILRAYCEHKRSPVQVPKECAASSDAELGARLASCVLNLNFLHIKRHWVAKHSNLSLAKNAESKQCFDHVELSLCSAILKGPVTTRARAVDAL